MNIVVPMAGASKRFADAGFKLPKPLIDLNGKPMIKSVIDNIGLNGTYIFLVQKEHVDRFAIDDVLLSFKKNCQIRFIDGLTEGAAVTCLKAKSLIDNNEPLLIANSDQLMDWSPEKFEEYLSISDDIDGTILTYDSQDPKNSFAKLDTGGRFVIDVQEKKVISQYATCGVYYWKRGSDFVWSAEQMIRKNIRTNNEFYVAPSYNELIAGGKRIEIYPIKRHHPIGTPQDLEIYVRNQTVVSCLEAQ